MVPRDDDFGTVGDGQFAPRLFPGVMVSSTFTDLQQHRAALIRAISRKYGQIPESQDRNPNGLSITELEFDEAQRLGRPILLFIMGPDHRVREADIELDAEKRAKLEAFCEKAKRIRSDSAVHRVY